MPVDAVTRVYRSGVLESDTARLEDVDVYLQQGDALVWVDLIHPTASELHALAEELGVHELALEDVLSPHERPKLDVYEHHLFFSCHAMTLDRENWRLDECEIDVLVGDRWLVTVRKDESASLRSVADRAAQSPKLMGHGVNFLFYALLDHVIDQYFDVVAAFEDYYDEVSDGIFGDEPLNPTEQRRWFAMRQALVRFHRLAVPLREAVSGVMRRNGDGIASDLYPYFQDAYDHILVVGEATDSLRELVGTIVETNISLRDYHQNMAMKKVTSWAAIIAVPTLVSGYYGMNVPYPGYGQHSGVVASAGLIVILSGGLFAVFRRKDWI